MPVNSIPLITKNVEINRRVGIADFPSIGICTEDTHFQKSLDHKVLAPDLHLFTFRISATSKAVPKRMKLLWKVPAINTLGMWKYGCRNDKRLQYDWEKEHLQSQLSVNAPLVCLYGYDDTNTITFACSDALNTLKLNSLLREEDNHHYCFVELFSEQMVPMVSYEMQLRVDLRKFHFNRALQETVWWWEGLPQMTPTPVPELARLPVYSTWYSFHQNLEEEKLLEECRMAHEQGFRMVIIDDGWQTTTGHRGYDYVGDWLPERFPDIKGLVAKIKGIGMAIGLWFAVPYCGKNSRAYQRFKGKFLTENHHWAPILDPRYPEIRAYIRNTFVNAVQAWDLDAIKLDFIDDFRVYPETPLEQHPDMDHENINEAVYELLGDINEALKRVRPKICIEFRQWYTGPIMRKFGNMFRAFDCPNDALSNKIMTTDLRLLSGNTSVHSDMVTWNTNEPVALAALQLIHVLFSVPQLSVLQSELPLEHQRMITFYIGYWVTHSYILLEADFKAVRPSANYPVLQACSEHHGIYAIFESYLLSIKGLKQLDLINGTTENTLLIYHYEEPQQYFMQVFNCTGDLLEEKGISVGEQPVQLSVPIAGMARLSKVGNH